MTKNVKTNKSIATILNGTETTMPLKANRQKCNFHVNDTTIVKYESVKQY